MKKILQASNLQDFSFITMGILAIGYWVLGIGCWRLALNSQKPHFAVKLVTLVEPLCELPR